MTRFDKKLAMLKANPKGDWKISDLQSIAKYFNINWRQPGTSHVTFNCAYGCLTVPSHKPIKPIYIKKFVELIETLQESKND